MTEPAGLEQTGVKGLGNRPSRRPRIAWLGPVGDFGVPGAGKLLLRSLLDSGVAVDLYHPGEAGDLPDVILAHPGVEVRAVPNRWRWDQWYSRNRVMSFISSLGARAFAHRALMRKLGDHARAVGYDAIFQYSQSESFGSGRTAPLPPRLVHPCSHAAGELRWHRHESKYARGSENFLAHYLVRTILAIRAVKQKRDLATVAVVVGPSQVFVNQVVDDYNIEQARTAVLRHPVDTVMFRPSGQQRDPARKLRLLYVSRISARKGVEAVVELSHRLDDLRNDVHIEVVGGHTLWSDYRRHLRDLNAAIASYCGQVRPNDMPAYLRAGDALLVPSTYEPGSLVFGEALASGIPVVASDAVGPTEVVNADCCRTFSAGDAEGFERAVRGLVADLRTRWDELSRSCRREALTHFSPDAVGSRLYEILSLSTGQRAPKPNIRRSERE